MIRLAMYPIRFGAPDHAPHDELEGYDRRMRQKIDIPRVIGPADLRRSLLNNCILVRFPMDDALNDVLRGLNGNWDKVERAWSVAGERAEELVTRLREYVAGFAEARAFAEAWNAAAPTGCALGRTNGTYDWGVAFEANAPLDALERSDLIRALSDLGGTFKSEPRGREIDTIHTHASVPGRADAAALRTAVVTARERASARAHGGGRVIDPFVAALAVALAAADVSVEPDVLTSALVRAREQAGTEALAGLRRLSAPAPRGVVVGFS